jgi:hypothetical protein
MGASSCGSGLWNGGVDTHGFIGIDAEGNMKPNMSMTGQPMPTACCCVGKSFEVILRRSLSGQLSAPLVKCLKPAAHG